MPTRLLLEGPDIEELLARVRDEHGGHARIVAAEKVRTGGLAGFFAKQRFELAVELDDEDADDENEDANGEDAYDEDAYDEEEPGVPTNRANGRPEPTSVEDLVDLVEARESHLADAAPTLTPEERAAAFGAALGDAAQFGGYDSGAAGGRGRGSATGAGGRGSGGRASGGRPSGGRASGGTADSGYGTGGLGAHGPGPYGPGGLAGAYGLADPADTHGPADPAGGYDAGDPADGYGAGDPAGGYGAGDPADATDPTADPVRNGATGRSGTARSAGTRSTAGSGSAAGRPAAAGRTARNGAAGSRTGASDARTGTAGRAASRSGNGTRGTAAARNRAGTAPVPGIADATAIPRLSGAAALAAAAAEAASRRAAAEAVARPIRPVGVAPASPAMPGTLPGEGGAAGPATVPVLPAAYRGAAYPGLSRPAAELMAMGVPEALAVRAVGPDRYTAVLAAVAGIPVAPPPPDAAGEILALVGDIPECTALGECLSEFQYLDGSRVLVAGPVPAGTGVPPARRILGPDDAARRAGKLRADATPRVVAVAAPVDGRSALWANAVLAALRPTATWALVDATRKITDTARHLLDLGHIDALAVHSAAVTADPGSILTLALELGIPIGFLDGRPASPDEWAGLLCAHMGGEP